MKSIFFVTNNPYKIDEVNDIAQPFGLKIIQYSCNIRELQTTDRVKLIEHKTLEAFKTLRYPVLVDHSSLEIKSLNGMPGTLTQLFWDNLEGKICDIVSSLGNREAQAVSTVGYCDGRQIYHQEGVVTGSIANAPIGDRLFQWDSIFIPNGQVLTYAQMSIEEKNKISQRKIAFESMFNYIISQ